MRTLARLQPADAGAVHALLAACGQHLAAQGFHNWDPPAPLARVAEDARSRELYGVFDDARLVASFTLAPEPVRPYLPPPWRDPALPALHLNRLAVHPERQRTGLGRWCMAAVERRAAALARAAVRFDVLAANAPLRAWYERLGYVARGERAHDGWTFACYEKELSAISCQLSVISDQEPRDPSTSPAVRASAGR